jgi:type II secretory pathway pseudopilin PulG
MKALNILIPMHLAGQGETVGSRRDEGYAMAALIIGIAVMAIVMTAAMPVWKHAAQREKEAELVFRGEQYVHAIGLFQRKYANAFPPSIDVLVEQ